MVTEESTEEDLRPQQPATDRVGHIQSLPERGEKKTEQEVFVVVKDLVMPLLGLPAIQSLPL